MTAPAAISVIVVTDRAETLADVLGFLRAQSINRRVELVVPTPGDAASFDALDHGELAGVKVVPVDAVTPIALARAAGVRAASAPYVFIGETHSFAAPDMLERIVEAHEAGWDRVAPVFTNANPTTAMSWAAFLLDYGRYAAPAASGEAQVPIYNCSYRRERLLALEPRLDGLIASGSTLNEDLRAAGCRFYRSGEASIAHVNVATPLAFLQQRYLIGRNLAARFARRWPAWRRALYVAGSPLLPPVLAVRTLRSDGMRARLRETPRLTLVALLVGLVARAVGEAAGYAAGAGTSEGELDEMEIHKMRYT